MLYFFKPSITIPDVRYKFNVLSIFWGFEQLNLYSAFVWAMRYNLFCSKAVKKYFHFYPAALQL